MNAPTTASLAVTPSTHAVSTQMARRSPTPPQRLLRRLALLQFLLLRPLPLLLPLSGAARLEQTTLPKVSAPAALSDAMPTVGRSALVRDASIRVTAWPVREISRSAEMASSDAAPTPICADDSIICKIDNECEHLWLVVLHGQVEFRVF
jgi:hypothetical protein